MKREWLRLAASVGFAAVLCGTSAAWAQIAPPLGVAAVRGPRQLGRDRRYGQWRCRQRRCGFVARRPRSRTFLHRARFPPLPFIRRTTESCSRRTPMPSPPTMRCWSRGRVRCCPTTSRQSEPWARASIRSCRARPILPANATLTLNGTGVFIFNVDSSLTANVLSNVVGTANPCNIFWRVGSSATLNGTNFRGTVVASASITLGSGANLAGRALAGTGASRSTPTLSPASRACLPVP